MNTEVIHNEALHRYEIHLDGAKVGHADYKVEGDVLVFDHTEVDPAQQGKNLAGILMRAALDDVRERIATRAASCPARRSRGPRRPGRRVDARR